MGSGDEGRPSPGEGPFGPLAWCSRGSAGLRVGGAAGLGAIRATSPEKLSAGSECGASSNCWETPNSGISLSWQVELNRQLGSDSRQLLKAKQWSVVVGCSILLCLFSKCGCGLHLLTAFLLNLLVASPVTHLMNISGKTSQACLLQIKFNDCICEPFLSTQAGGNPVLLSFPNFNPFPHQLGKRLLNPSEL